MTQKPDLTTFRTDFNVTFGVCVCFDLLFDEPAISLVERGVHNIVFPTMWFSEIPYLTGKKIHIFLDQNLFRRFSPSQNKIELDVIHIKQSLKNPHSSHFLGTISAVQFQQSWAYANNVNLLAANINWPSMQCSGSGIYAGRLGALNVFVSESPVTKILIAKVPTALPVVAVERDLPKFEFVQNAVYSENFPKYDTFESSLNEFSNLSDSLGHLEVEDLSYEILLSQDDLTKFTVQFLDFSKGLSQKGTACNEGICCSYDISVSDHGEQVEKV